MTIREHRALSIYGSAEWNVDALGPVVQPGSSSPTPNETRPHGTAGLADAHLTAGHYRGVAYSCRPWSWPGMYQALSAAVRRPGFDRRGFICTGLVRGPSGACLPTPLLAGGEEGSGLGSSAKKGGIPSGMPRITRV